MLSPAKIARKTFLNNYLARMLGLVLAVTFGLAGCAKQESATATVRPALAYKIPATSGVESEVFAGDIHARVEADHAFRVAGKVSQRLVDAGATVKKGQPLARMIRRT